MKIYNLQSMGFRRGDVVFVKDTRPDSNPDSHVMRGDHPAVIVQNEMGNAFSSNLIVAFLTSQVKRLDLQTHVPIDHYSGLRPSMIKTEQLATIDKASVAGYITHLRSDDIALLNKALMVSLGLVA